MHCDLGVVRCMTNWAVVNGSRSFSQRAWFRIGRGKKRQYDYGSKLWVEKNKVRQKLK